MTIASLLPAVSYVIISIFTPGPSNIACASMGVQHGYRHTLNFMLGLAAGVFAMMLVSGWVSTTLLHAFPVLETALRYVGAAYILYLAYGILKASYTFAEQEVKPLGFGHGLMLQLLNPKLVVFAFTLFTAFLAPITGNPALLLVAVSLLALTSFCATSVWALFGTGIKTYLRSQRAKATANLILALFLVATALILAGVL